MDIRKLQRAIVDGLEDVKAQNIVVFNTEHLSPLFERVIIASGTSNRQTKALAASVRDAVKSKGLPAPRTEGEDNGEWIIVDCGTAVVHVMQPSIRDYYRLEEIWGGKPVKMKVDDTPVRLVKASEEPAPPKSAAKKAAAKKGAAAKAAPAGKSAAKSAPRPAAKTAPSRKSPPAKRAAPPARAPAKKSAPAKSAPTKTVVVKPAAKKSVAPRKPVTRSVGVKRSAPAKKAPAGKRAKA
ncbi:MAG TPA: ribosome silencing factor [Piscinibacter sp.]|nr:ribosome silencing factor [Piscinibacter sp.]HPG78040.1 ribosome silencing factor [Piscinibacter sp.]